MRNKDRNILLTYKYLSYEYSIAFNFIKKFVWRLVDNEYFNSARENDSWKIYVCVYVLSSLHHVTIVLPHTHIAIYYYYY